MEKLDLLRQSQILTKQLAEVNIRIAMIDWASHNGLLQRRCVELYSVVTNKALPLLIRGDAAEELIERLK